MKTIWSIALWVRRQFISLVRKPCVFLSGAGAGPLVAALSFATVAMISWVLTIACYFTLATPPHIDQLERLSERLKQIGVNSNEEGTVLAGKDKFVISRTNPAAIRGLSTVADWEVSYERTDNTTPQKMSILRIRVTETRSDALRGGTLDVTCQVAIPGTGNKWPTDSEGTGSGFERVLDPFTMYLATPSSWFTPATFTIETPASVHVLDKALLYGIVYVNKESDTYRTQLKYRRNESAETQLIRSIGNAVQATYGKVPRDVQGARRVNGPIQWCTVWAFFALLILLCSRFVAYVSLETHALPLDDLGPRTLGHSESQSTSDAAGAGAATPGVTGVTDPLAATTADPPAAKMPLTVADLRNPEHVTLTFEAEEHRLKEAKRLRKKAVERVTAFGCETSPAFLELYIEAASAFLLSRTYTAVPEFVDSTASSLIDERNARLGFVKYLLWAIPSIGFVGTVVGIGDALLATIDVDAVDPVKAAIAKSMVSSSIGVAFDTTLVALLLSLIGMLVFHLVTQTEELIVNDAGRDVRSLFVQPGIHMSDEARASDFANRVSGALQGVSDSLEKVAVLQGEITVASEHLKTTADELRGISGLDEKVKGGVNRIAKGLNELYTRQRKQWEGYVHRTELRLKTIKVICIIIVVAMIFGLLLGGLVTWSMVAGKGWA